MPRVLALMFSSRSLAHPRSRVPDAAPTRLQQLELDGLGHGSDGLTRRDATLVISGLRDLERHDPSPDPPTARQRAFLRALRRQLGLEHAPAPATRGAASLEINRLRTEHRRAVEAQNDARARAEARTREATSTTHGEGERK